VYILGKEERRLSSNYEAAGIPSSERLIVLVKYARRRISATHQILNTKPGHAIIAMNDLLAYSAAPSICTAEWLRVPQDVSEAVSMMMPCFE
jgi:DNA-binding LacI/PurR family transcriptional regulator